MARFGLSIAWPRDVVAWHVGRAAQAWLALSSAEVGAGSEWVVDGPGVSWHVASSGRGRYWHVDARWT